MKKAGYYTVEATFIMTITIWVILALCYGGMYVHDRVVLSSFVNESMATWLASGDEVEEKEWEKSVKENVEKQLFILQVIKIEANKQLLSKKAKVSYQLPITWNWLKKILLNGKSKGMLEVVREDIRPANYMWDAKK